MILSLPLSFSLFSLSVCVCVSACIHSEKMGWKTQGGLGLRLPKQKTGEADGRESHISHHGLLSCSALRHCALLFKENYED